MDVNIAVIAGFVSTALFALGALPMLTKAFRTRNLASYSLGNILLSNVGNAIYSIYVFQLPPGPVWFLHSYNLVTTALMLLWYLRYEGLPPQLRSLGSRLAIRPLSKNACARIGHLALAAHLHVR